MENPTPVNADLLRVEYEHINSYVRTGAQLHLAWYTFFVTINYAVVGYVASQLEKDAFTELTVLALAIVLIVQGIIACSNYETYIGSSDARIATILSRLASPDEERPPSPIPSKLYRDATILTIVSFAALILFWCVILVHCLIGRAG